MTVRWALVYLLLLVWAFTKIAGAELTPGESVACVGITLVLVSLARHKP